jgi:[acyl-carrier-protein] S-malonyltransferase
LSTAYVFPGQGSQFVGMGAQFMSLRPVFRGAFDRANDTLGFDLKTLCLTGPEDALADTANTQPAIFTHSLASFYMTEMSGEVDPPAFLAGHSLGEISALCAAGALSFEDGVRLTQVRGQLMKLAGELAPGGMAAIIGMTRDALATVCAGVSAAHSPGVVIANDNSPGQIVISGGKDAVAAACDAAKAAGAKRALPLAVSIAAHSPLMAPAAEDFTAFVARLPIAAARIPVIANTSVTPITHPDDIRAELAAQLTSPVRWVETVAWLHANGVTRFVELGPKDVLSGLIKRIVTGVETVQVG